MMIRPNRHAIKKGKYILIGLLAALSLFLFYFIIASLVSGVNFAVNNFQSLWYWMILLIVGFGTQIGLFFYAKDTAHVHAGSATASTGISSASMIACCVHHLADIAPFLGITTMGLFLAEYQSVFLIAGIMANLLGITYLIGVVSTTFSRSTMKKIWYALLFISLSIILLHYLALSNNDDSKNESRSKDLQFETLTHTDGIVEFKVTPQSRSEYALVIDTHSRELRFDLIEISILLDDLGNTYRPILWNGSPPEGHHREGVLIFPPVHSNATSLTLVITDSTAREFYWKVPE